MCRYIDDFLTKSHFLSKLLEQLLIIKENIKEFSNFRVCYSPNKMKIGTSTDYNISKFCLNVLNSKEMTVSLTPERENKLRHLV